MLGAPGHETNYVVAQYDAIFSVGDRRNEVRYRRAGPPGIVRQAFSSRVLGLGVLGRRRPSAAALEGPRRRGRRPSRRRPWQGDGCEVADAPRRRPGPPPRRRRTRHRWPEGRGTDGTTRGAERDRERQDLLDTTMSNGTATALRRREQDRPDDRARAPREERGARPATTGSRRTQRQDVGKDAGATLDEEAGTRGRTSTARSCSATAHRGHCGLPRGGASSDRSRTEAERDCTANPLLGFAFRRQIIKPATAGEYCPWRDAFSPRES